MQTATLKDSARTHTHTAHTRAHLFEDPVNLSNSALGVLLMGDGEREGG